ncbi:MAG: hypothetical protein QQW96_12680 [Tychonema bourrellyi B0820]|nr:hypothetical protein [Tychonema bourrellyi B0820]
MHWLSFVELWIALYLIFRAIGIFCLLDISQKAFPEQAGCLFHNNYGRCLSCGAFKPLTRSVGCHGSIADEARETRKG